MIFLARDCHFEYPAEKVSNKTKQKEKGSKIIVILLCKVIRSISHTSEDLREILY